MWALGDSMKGLDYVASTAGTEEERAEADWLARRLDLIEWEPDDCPQEWGQFMPGLHIEQVADVWCSPAWSVELLVFRFARITEQVATDVGKPTHFLIPAAFRPIWHHFDIGSSIIGAC